METAAIQTLAALITRIKAQGFAALQAIHGLDKVQLLSWSDEIVAAYGKVYREHKALIMDRDLLPCPKDDLRAALKVQFYALAMRRDTAAMEDITHAYVNLSRFQTIAPSDKQKLDELNLHAVPMVDPSAALRDRPDLSEQERHFLECFRTFHVYLGVVEQEKEELRRDFSLFVQTFSREPA